MGRYTNGAIFNFNLAGDPGIEPGLPDSESGVLPLDESPFNSEILAEGV